MTPRDLQIQREAGARQAAMGRRAGQIKDGHMGPVLKRWINSDILPIAELLREVSTAYLAGDMVEVAQQLSSPTIELSQRERPLAPLMEWCLRGSSPGRAEQTTFAEDLALAFMATLVTRLSAADCTVSAGMSLAAEALRDTVQGQFITSIQGATAMQALRDRKPELWQQKKSLQRIAMQLASQVKPQMLAEERGEVELETRGHRKVLKVLDYKGDIRRLELRRTPDVVDWSVMTLCWPHEGTSPNRSVWLAFAGMLLAIAQRTGGWFEVGHGKKTAKRHKTPRMLVLSVPAQEAIARDVERWLKAGFNSEPMLVPPENGDYLTVKHKKVTGQRPPKGLITQPEESYAWLQGAVALSDTPWAVNPYALPEATEGLPLDDLTRIAEHRRMGLDPFYLPVNMDFRGRIYYRTSWVGPQSGDLGKSLLCFPDKARELLDGKPLEALIMHLAGLYGGPDKLDKAPWSARYQWWKDGWDGDCALADKPLTLAAHYALVKEGRWDDVPIQLDGTCNGLQHLSALFRDEEAARHVNLCASTLEEAPADVYGLVAGIVEHGLKVLCVEERWDWHQRLVDANMKFNRALCKGPVMVLPYGGTREAVRLAVKASVLEQLDPGDSTETPWHRYEGDNYEAFRERPLGDHPLFNADIGHLSSLIWESISPAIPRAMAAMGTLQEIGKWVGSRALCWATGPMACPNEQLWVIQAKSKATRKQVTMKGFHLPDMVRRLTLMTQSNEVDPRAHRTGIVANFIHSLDADHLARSIGRFRAQGGGCVGAVHDCLLVRPSEAALMGRCLREAFVELYEDDPLSQPVRLVETEGPEVGVVTEYDSWRDLARAAGVEFPARGSFDIREVLDSGWFFS